METTSTVGQALTQAAEVFAEAGVESPWLDAQLLMAHILGCKRVDLIAHPERVLGSIELDAFHSAVQKCATRYPLPYIIGHREFFCLDMLVKPGVLVPRPETEVLVEECVKRLKGISSPLVADIGAGSGAICVALAASIADATVYATEISPEAEVIARANIEKHNVSDRVNLLIGDMLEPLRKLGRPFDAIVSNPPYIPTGDIASLQPEVRLYEPAQALDGGADGLDAYKRLMPDSYDILVDGGFVAVEVGKGEAHGVCELATAAGFVRCETVQDLAGIERVVVAYK